MSTPPRSSHALGSLLTRALQAVPNLRVESAPHVLHLFAEALSAFDEESGEKNSVQLPEVEIIKPAMSVAKQPHNPSHVHFYLGDGDERSAKSGPNPLRNNAHVHFHIAAGGVHIASGGVPADKHVHFHLDGHADGFDSSPKHVHFHLTQEDERPVSAPIRTSPPPKKLPSSPRASPRRVSATSSSTSRVEHSKEESKPSRSWSRVHSPPPSPPSLPPSPRSRRSGGGHTHEPDLPKPAPRRETPAKVIRLEVSPERDRHRRLRSPSLSLEGSVSPEPRRASPDNHHPSFPVPSLPGRAHSNPTLPSTRRRSQDVSPPHRHAPRETARRSSRREEDEDASPEPPRRPRKKSPDIDPRILRDISPEPQRRRAQRAHVEHNPRIYDTSPDPKHTLRNSVHETSFDDESESDSRHHREARVTYAPPPPVQRSYSESSYSDEDSWSDAQPPPQTRYESEDKGRHSHRQERPLKMEESNSSSRSHHHHNSYPNRRECEQPSGRRHVHVVERQASIMKNTSVMHLGHDDSDLAPESPVLIRRNISKESSENSDGW